MPLLVCLLAIEAEPAERFSLTVASIMRGPQLVGYEPSLIRWSGDSRQIYFQWKQYTDSHEKDTQTWVVNRDGSELRKLSDEEAKLAPPSAGDTSPDKSRMVYARDGDLFLYDNRTGKTMQLTRTGETETNPHFTRDGKRVWFTRGNNLYVMSTEGSQGGEPLFVQMTDIQSAGAPAGGAQTTSGGGSGTLDQENLGRGQGQGLRGGSRTGATASGEPPKGTASQEFLKKQEAELIEAVKERAKKRQETEARRKKENPRKPFRLQAQQSLTGLQLAPDEKNVLAMMVETSPGGKTSLVPNFVTESGYTEDISSRGMVGDVQPGARLLILNVETGESKFVDHGQKTGEPGKEQERSVQLNLPIWSEDGTKTILVGRSADHKDRWIFALDVATGKTRVIAKDHDPAWLGGPAGLGGTAVGWMKGDREVYFDSERSGYSHLYVVPWEGGEPRALTSGNWELLDAKLSRDKSRFFLNTNEAGPPEHHVYMMSAQGGPRTRLTTTAGSHRAWISPDEKSFVDLYSYINQPPDLFVQDVNISGTVRAEGKARRLTTSPSPEFAQYPWLDAPTIHFHARDGVEIPARLFKPAKQTKGAPAVVFVHGAGYAQNVHKYWSPNYYREYMFQHILMEKGYTVIDVDYRGSAGYGRDWRTAIYEHMGGKDLDDVVDATKYLISEQGIDPRRIGIYGGSYGGFLTLMALFTSPDTFAAGAALRPVTDWSHYNHGYTSDILNEPQTDSEAYRKSSPIYFAQNLKSALLICHGMVDTNVHFQDTVRLTQRLIELGKTNWSVAPYPVEDHGFVEPTSWTDEYNRILDLFERNLKDPKT